MLLQALILLFCDQLIASHKPEYDLGEATPNFDAFRMIYNKTYKDEAETKKRFEIFKENLKIINLRNEEEPYAVFDVNQLSDLTTEEFLATHTGLIPDARNNPCRVVTDKDVTTSEAPDTLDWRAQNVVTRVKNQGSCNACWAFSATGVIESQYAIKHKKLVELSEQELLDCDPTGGCQGGWPRNAFRKLMSIGGLQAGKDYPYVGKKLRCRVNQNAVVAKLTDCQSYSLSKEELFREVLFKVGPLSVGIDARVLQQYRGGILKKCPLERLNHAVILVGYGTEQGVPYWIIKNSYTERWGEGGYFRLMRGINACGFTTHMSSASIQ